MAGVGLAGGRNELAGGSAFQNNDGTARFRPPSEIPAPNGQAILGFLNKGVVMVCEHGEGSTDHRSRPSRICETKPWLPSIVLGIEIGFPHVREGPGRRIGIRRRGRLDKGNRYQETGLYDLIDVRLGLQASVRGNGALWIPARNLVILVVCGRNEIVAKTNLDVQLFAGLPFILDVITLPGGSVVRCRVTDEAEKAGWRVQQHAGETVPGLRGVQTVCVSRAARELIKPHRCSPTVIETVNMIEHEAGAE